MVLHWIQKQAKKYSQYTPLAIFVLLLAITWVYLESKKHSTNELVHALLQEKVQAAISDQAVKKNPNITRVVFHKIWTKETGNDNEVKVVFSYSLLEELSKQKSTLIVDGQALLNPSDEEENVWVLSNFQVTDSLLDFDEPMIIKAK